jgi:hypothetical protein
MPAERKRELRDRKSRSVLTADYADCTDADPDADPSAGGTEQKKCPEDIFPRAFPKSRIEV